MPAVLTADLEQSTSLAESELSRIIDVIRLEADSLIAEGLVSDMRFFRGDSFQAVIPDAAEAFRVAMILKTAINRLGQDETGRGDKILYDVAVSVGYGKIGEYSDMALQNDRPFILSGRGLELLKKQSRTAGVFTGNETVDRESDVVFFLYEWIMKQWNISSAEIVYHKLKGLTEKEIAAELGISQSAVNQRSHAACWHGLDKLIKRCAAIDRASYE